MKTKRKFGFNRVKVVDTCLSATDFFEKFRDSQSIGKTHNYRLTVPESRLIACILHKSVRKFRFAYRTGRDSSRGAQINEFQFSLSLQRSFKSLDVAIVFRMY